MNNLKPVSALRAHSLLAAALLLLLSLASTGVPAQTGAARSPTETVREFYRMMRERHFREAFALSIYRPAIEGLSAEEFEELRPDFEKMAKNIPEKIEINGEQMSGDTATVFVKIADVDSTGQAEPVTLMRDGSAWVVGDRENQEVVRKSGKRFFFEARIETHHSEVQEVLQRINLAQLAYASQHNKLYADLPTLINSGLVPKDIETTDSTGYRFHLALGKDARSWTAGAEPASYGRTGRLSFFMDQTGIRSADTGGKPLILPPGAK
ncbi:MAG TPA: hypothetical protein VF723_16185 [Pyrinomonadaceae bacterium]|jgi:hypothetical protein